MRPIDESDPILARICLLSNSSSPSSAIRHDKFRKPIAIIGMGCRFPGGSKSWQDYWEYLKSETMEFFPCPATDGIGASILQRAAQERLEKHSCARVVLAEDVFARPRILWNPRKEAESWILNSAYCSRRPTSLGRCRNYLLVEPRQSVCLSGSLPTIIW